ncbi:hypothetical protein MBLNU13_g03372t3 [Cladosporium sp. NU13]
MTDWRQRPWNTLPVRDEKHTIWLLHVSNLIAEDAATGRDEGVLRQFNSELEAHLEAYFREVGVNAGLPHGRERVEELYSRLEDEENLTLLRHLLLLHKDALQVLPLHRGIGRYLTVEHLRRLEVHYEYDLDGTGHEAAGLDGGNQLDLPVVEDDPSLWADSYEVYKALEGVRLSMIERGMIRPPRLGAAIDMFWLQYSRLQIPRRFREATSDRENNKLMIDFLVDDTEIEERREEMGTDRWPEEMRRPNAELWESTMEGYPKVAEHFKKLNPPAVLINYVRGWLD